LIAARTIRDHTIPVGSVVNVGMEFVTTLDETTDEVKYSISFDPSRLTFLSADIGPAFEIWTKTPHMGVLHGGHRPFRDDKE
jgi:hypothetical protein